MGTILYCIIQDTRSVSFSVTSKDTSLLLVINSRHTFLLCRFPMMFSTAH
jgi:hypothetical protein